MLNLQMAEQGEKGVPGSLHHYSPEPGPAWAEPGSLHSAPSFLCLLLPWFPGSPLPMVSVYLLKYSRSK